LILDAAMLRAHAIKPARESAPLFIAAAGAIFENLDGLDAIADRARARANR